MLLKGKRRKSFRMILLVAIMFVATFITNVTTYATEATETESTEEVQLDSVDLSKGITHIYGEDGTSLLGINLNGNSVIIKESENSSSTKQLNNFYIDKNRNGEIDNDETAAVVGDSVDVTAGPTIYGVYKQKTETPISITVNSGFVPVVYGIYQGEMTSKDTTAITLTVNGGTIPGALFAAYGSTVNTQNATAADIQINGGSVSCTLAGGYDAEITTTGKTAVIVGVNGGTVPATIFGVNNSTLISDGARAIEIVADAKSTEFTTNNIMGAYGGTIEVKNAEVSGVDISIKSGQIGYLYALNSTQYTIKDSTAPAIHGELLGGTVYNAQYVLSGSVKSDGTNTTLIDLDASTGQYSQLYGTCASDIDAGKNTNLALDLDLTDSVLVTGEVKGIVGSSSYSSSTDYNVVGSVDIDITPAAIPESGNNINNIYGVYNYVILDGDVDVFISNVRASWSYGINNYVDVKGNLIYETKDSCELNYSYGANNSKIGKDATITVSGYSGTGSSSCSIYGIYGRYKTSEDLVGGDVTFNYKGGKAQYLYGVYSSSISTNVYPEISGKVVVNVNSGTVNDFYGTACARVSDDVTITIAEGCILNGTIRGMYEAKTDGNATIHIFNSNESSSRTSLYCAQNIYVGQNMNITVSGGYYYGVWGIYGYSSNVSTVKGNTELLIQDVNKDVENCSSGSYSYGLAYVHVGGTAKVTTKNSKLYTYYGTYYATCEKDITVDMTNVDVYSYLYGADTGAVAGAVDCTLTDVTAQCMYGAYLHGAIGGNVTSTITKAVCSNELDGIYGYNSSIAGNVTTTITDSATCSLYAMNSVMATGAGSIVVDNCTSGSDTTYSSTTGASGANIAGGTTITITDLSVAGNLYPYSSNSNESNGDVSIDIDGLTQTTGYSTQVTISNYVMGEQKLHMDIDEESVIPDGTTIYPTTGEFGVASALYKGEMYYAGKIIFDENVTYDKIHFIYGCYLIPEGVTIKANEAIYLTGGSMLVEGALEGAFAGEVNSSGKYTGGSVWMNGGTLAQDPNTIATIYYSLAVNYLEKGGTVTKYSGYTPAHSLRPEVIFVAVGNTMKYKVVTNEGYTLKGVTVKTANADAATDAAVSGIVYSFVMEASETTLNVDFEANQIVVGKTVTDPVVKLEQEYTDESPAYDMASMAISNDALEGEVKYSVDDIYGLPEGLELSAGKIIGTPTTAYEEGKKVVIHVTGKNDTKADVTINFVVTAGEGTQTSQDGRITIDETNAIAYLNGNSVVIETKDNYTAIYVDDDKDGLADSEAPAYYGDLTNYTVYGIRNADAKNKLRITMNGGTIGTLYAAYNGDLIDDKESLQIYINGGSVGSLCGLYNATTSGIMTVQVGTDATVKTYTEPYGSSYGGYYYDNKGSVTIRGTYVVEENITPTNLYVYGSVTIPKDVVVSVTNALYRYSSSYIYLKGELAATKVSTTSGYLFVQDGVLPEGNTWTCVYYPVTCSTNLDNTSITFSSYYTTVTEDEKTVGYLRAGMNIPATMTEVAGYDYYYSVDDADYVATTTESFTFEMPRKAISLKAEYVPKQISVNKQFVDPAVIINTTYTEENPVYDLASLLIVDDTTAAYGGEVKYTLKNGCTLPEGLEIVNNKIIGTPTVENQTGTTVTFVVTGRNGTTANVELTIAVMPVDYEEVDINDTVTISDYNIYLNGASVVIAQDSANASKASIYPDYNGDKLADNNKPLLIDNAASYTLGSYTIYGYSDTETAYDGDISITLKSGSVKSLYGVYGASETSPAVVNGNVAVYIEGGSITNAYSTVCGVYYGSAKNVTMEITGGTHKYVDFIAVSDSTVTNDVNYKVDGRTKITGSSGATYNACAYATSKSTVGGDVNVTLGANETEYGLYGGYTYYYGVSGSDITGNVNYEMDGYWYPSNTYFVYTDSTVGKNLDVNWNSGTISYYTYCVYDAEVTGNVLVDVSEGATITGYYLYLLREGKAASVYVNIPDSVIGTVPTVTLYYNGTESVDNTAYIYNKGNLTLDGTYTITDDLSLSTLSILEGGNITIAEETSVAVNPTANYKVSIEDDSILTNNGIFAINNSYYQRLYGDIINNGSMSCAAYLYVYGTITNNQTLESTYTLYVYSPGILDNYKDLTTTDVSIYSNTSIINRETGTWTLTKGLSNSGKVVNYGSFNQTYNDKTIGTIYTTTELNLYDDLSKYITSTSNIKLYSPVTVEYPSNCIESATIAGVNLSSSGVEGDTNQYIQGGTSFTVTLGNELLDDNVVVLNNVTYGPEDTVATPQTDGTWVGTAVYEPFTVRVNYDAAEGIEPIILDKTSDRIENTEEEKLLVVDNYYSYSSPLYDLTEIEISNDDVETGVVSYTVDSQSSLPAGMYLKDGRLYGTLKEACAEEQKITFIVRGKNQTTAYFELTLGSIDKKVPTWSIPTDLQAVVGDTLADVYVKPVTGGKFSWPDDTVSVGDKVTTLEDVELIFTPTDVDNYDWETAATAAGAIYAEGVITCKVSIQVVGGVPIYTIPENLTATYGQTFGDVEIPSGDNEGTFTWNYSSTKTVGTAGTHYYYVTYTPDDTDNYQTVTSILVKLVVNKAVPTYEKLESVSQACGSTLADIILPEVEGGKYQWITTATTVPIDGTQYQAGYKPTDTYNYDWTSLDEWNSAWGCVIFPVTVYVEHTYATAWTYDDEYHWHACLDSSCSTVENKAEHEWDNGTVKTPATETEMGVKEYTCECGATKEEEIPVLDHTQHTYGDTWLHNDDTHWKTCIFDGCTVTTEPEAHTWDEEEIVTQATETETGVMKYTCKCGVTKEEEIPVLPHSDHTYAEAWKYNSSTHWHVCTYEGCSSTTTAEEHIWDEGIIEIAATETTTGLMKYTCECGAKKTEDIPMLPHTNHTYSEEWKYNDDVHWHECTFDGCDETSEKELHAWNDGEVETPATETTTGVKKYTCECGATKTETIPVIEQSVHTSHTYAEAWKYNDDVHWHECTFAGCDATSEKKAHVWNDGVVETPATETTTGIKKYTCECGATKTSTIPVLAHTHAYEDTWSFDDTEHWRECQGTGCDDVSEKGAHQYGAAQVVVQATEDEEGTKKYTCQTCGYSYTEQYDVEDSEVEGPLEVDEEFEDEENQITYMVTSAGSEIEFIELGNENATEIVIPDTVTYGGVTYKVTSIADESFKNHKKLKKITIGANILTIGKKAFYGCKKLTTVKMGKNVQTIGDSAFQNCTALKKVEIPSKVKKIGKKAFYGCKKLTSITIKTTKLNTSKVGKDAFKKAGSANYSKLTVKVPKKKLKAYKTMLKKRGLSSKAKVKK